MIVYENANRLVPSRQRNGLWRETLGQKCELMPMIAVGGLQEKSFVGLKAKKRDSHE